MSLLDRCSGLGDVRALRAVLTSAQLQQQRLGRARQRCGGVGAQTLNILSLTRFKLLNTKEPCAHKPSLFVPVTDTRVGRVIVGVPVRGVETVQV